VSPAWKITVPASRLILLPSRESSVHSAGLIRSRKLSRSFLSDVYAPTDDENRYDYIPRTALPVLFPMETSFCIRIILRPGLQKALNAFDLVRIHRFRDLDKDVLDESTPSKMPSYKAMMDFASGCDKVKILLLSEKQAQAGEDFAACRRRLR
jgi:hypothetical protein